MIATILFVSNPWKFRRKMIDGIGWKINIQSCAIILFSFLSFPNSSFQLVGLFPKIEDLSSFTNVKISSTCGLQNNLMTYCISSVSKSSLTTCAQRSCLFGCCRSCTSSTPPLIDLFKDSLQSATGVYVSSQTHRYSSQFTSSLNFQDSGNLVYSSVSASSNFSFTAWINQEIGNKEGVLLHKEGVFTIILKEFAVTFLYFSKESPNIETKVDFLNINITQGIWYHIAVTVCGHDLALFVNGEITRTGTLIGGLNPQKNTLIIGQDFKGGFFHPLSKINFEASLFLSPGKQYKGLMQDMKYYSKGLTNREVIESQTGSLPNIPYTHCRCPESHPRLSPKNSFYCMKNNPASVQVVKRLSEESHVPEYLVDGEAITYWLSERVNDATIELDLKYSKLQVFLVSLLFYSPPSQGIKIERSLDFGKTYIAWQYYAIDCQNTFSLKNDGDLPYPDSVNCIQMSNPKPSWEAITFQPAEAGPDNKPKRPYGVSGCMDFYCSPKLLSFVQATNVKITLTGHTLVSHPSHKYFGIRRVIVGGTCDCHGHGKSCSFDDKATPNPIYKCQCDERTFTYGDQCEKCLPMYNDKLFERGNTVDAKPCKKCQCHDHADRCLYNIRLDIDPLDRSKPGGGVCVSCKHNTIGRHCDQCKPLYFRPSGTPLNAPDVCQPCDCVGPGVESGKYECEKDDTKPGVLAGQCQCKKYAGGRQCIECKSGFYQLSSTNPDGCVACHCHTPGTVNNGVSCHISSGQCSCKPNVIGVKCTNCKVGYYGLTSVNPLGCLPCVCNPLGSTLVTSCHPETGQCTCKVKYEGRACDQCKNGFFGALCETCTCNVAGIQTGSQTQCDKDTGQCNCKVHVTGTTCDRCKPGYYGLAISNPFGCLACSCDAKGTVGNSGQCDQLSGVCTCKRLVAGRSCNLCKVGAYGLSASKVDGCTKCNCNPKGTVSGDTTARDDLVCTSTGQCSCLSNVQGLQCDQCAMGYYWNPSGLGCLPCSCDIYGSTSHTCSTTGQCQCNSNLGITGLRCNECAGGFYGYQNGQCKACECNGAGRLRNVCDFTGQCTQCKRNVQGKKCESCKVGTQFLQANNPYGCSGAPSQQGPPRIVSKTSTAVSLAWSPPDDPNGVILKYDLHRNGTKIFEGLTLQYVDQPLSAFTNYHYDLYSFTAVGSAKSVDTLFVRTDGDVPVGLQTPVISQVKARSVLISWNTPLFPNGEILEYIVKSVKSDGSQNTHYRGLLISFQVTGLQPFTVYNFTVTACTKSGCTQSNPSRVSTQSAAPDSQPAPYTNQMVGGTSILITWDAPSQPNGEIQFYDMYQRSSPFTGSGNTIGVQLKPELRTFTASGLQPFTEYEFRVVSYTAQVKGSTSSLWSRIRTAEGVPSGIAKPSAVSLSSKTMDLSWSIPSIPTGIIIRYEIYRYEKESAYLFPILTTSTPGGIYSKKIKNLKAFTVYQFSVKACNSYRCTTHSPTAEARTRADIPSGQFPPTGVALNSSSVELSWHSPLLLNGPTSVRYVLDRIIPPYSFPPPEVIRGVQFSGFGYYQFSGNLIPDSATSLIELHFKTTYSDGTLLFASSVRQEDLIVIELRNGLPWFIFDTESGPGAFTVSSNTKKFNDGSWHKVTVSRDMREGKITVDDYFVGSGSGTGSKNVIGQILNVFIGGLPADFQIIRADNGDATLRRLSFIGCVRDFLFKKVPLDFKSAIKRENVPPLTDHCSVFPSTGIYFKGHGYMVLNKGVFNGGATFYLRFNLLTVYKDALIFYTANEHVHFIVYIQNKQLFVNFKTPTSTSSLLVSTRNFCDNTFHDVIIKSSARQLTSNIDNVESSVGLLPSDLTLTADTYIGGVPLNFTMAVQSLRALGVLTSFGGCIKDLKIGSAVNFQHVIKLHRNVDFNGCPSVTTISTCGNPESQTVYDGMSTKIISVGLKPFTEYLYRVRSYQNGVFGYADSEWTALRSGEGAPADLSSPRAIEVKALSARVSWSPPRFHNGLITHYYLRVYDVVNSVSIQKQKLDVTDMSETSIRNLRPASLYYITIEASTAAGGVESVPLIITTTPASPEGFLPPQVKRFPRALNISWLAPAKPNGRIISYQVELNNQIKYNGLGLTVYVENLDVYKKYALKVTVCGEAGCTNTITDVYTGELPPQNVIAPQLTVLGSKRIRVKWGPPQVKNGEIVKYEVYYGYSTSTVNMNLAFTATGATNQTILNNLTPGTTYYVRIKAFTIAGGTLGDAARIKTLESAPEGVPKPLVTPTSSTSFSVIIYAPTSPNGAVIRYKLIQDGVEVLNSQTLPGTYLARNLQPFSKHSFQVIVCTLQGCGSSDEVVSYTYHGKPVGGILLSITNVGSRSVQASWTRIAHPNGPINYKVAITGKFYVLPGVNFNVIIKTVDCFSGQTTNFTHTCIGLLPIAEYTAVVNGSNDAGFVLSNEVKFITSGDIPDGVTAPKVFFINSTTVQLTWPNPARSNGALKEYKLYNRYPSDDFGNFGTIVLKRGIFNNYILNDMKPFSNYSFWLEVRNEFGSTKSDITDVMTSETAPSGVDAPKISYNGARSIAIEVSPPAKSNGVIIRNIVYINRTIANITDASTVRIYGLTPFTHYNIHISACTKAGCTNSSGLVFRTLQDVPEGVSAPILTANGSRSVVIKWVEPQSNNGIIICYTIQRLKKDSKLPTTVAKLTAAFWNAYNDRTVQPYTTYDYRVVAETSAGGTPSPYNRITTPQAAPEGMDTPRVTIITQTSITIEWSKPTVTNGIIRHYLVSVSMRQHVRVDLDVFSYTATNLESFVLYTIVVSACTDGGCAQSSPISARTLTSPPKQQLPPSADPLSSTSLRVRWDEPQSPNGPIQRYILKSRTIESLITNIVTSPTAWSIIYQGTGTTFDHTGLGVYSLQQYIITCFTTEGDATSPESPHYRTGPGFPIAGPSISAKTINHTSIEILWTNPPIQQLKGEVKSYKVSYEIVGKAGLYEFGTFAGNVSSVIVNELRPSTTYDFRVSLFNGAGTELSTPKRATTLAGIPEGFDAPDIYRIDSRFIWLSWRPPRVPNGPIMNYTIIANDKRMDTVNGGVTFHKQLNLKPYTSYIIKLQVCTVFMCILSGGNQVKTYAAAPTDLYSPSLRTLSGSSIEVTWKAPMEKNGIMIGYELYRRSTTICPKTKHPVKKCTYISCSINKQLCGTQCYDPKLQTCCSGTLYPIDAKKSCCGTNHVTKNSPDDICCGGQFYPKQNTYQCCYGYYRQILPGQVCCQGNAGLIVGNGNTCCGDIPYDVNGDKKCLCGALYNRAGNLRQCCGNKVISIAETCCGKGVDARAYTFDSRKMCCGRDYVEKETSLCCVDDINQAKVYSYTSLLLKQQHKCCGTNSIPTLSQCCNTNPYDNSTLICSDRSMFGITGCGTGKTCPVSQKQTSYCNRCDFDSTNHICSHINGFFDPNSNNTDFGLCVSQYQQILLNTKDPNLFTFVDTGLSAHTKYEYYVVGRNFRGNVSSPVAKIKTLMGVPESLHPPIPTVLSANQIAVTWSPPIKPNGIITKYVLYRTKWSQKKEVKLYMGLSQSFLDKSSLEPFTGYLYTLSVCTNLCANISASSLVYTEESIPVNVKAPLVIPVSATSMRVNWSLPLNPNGVIVRYNVTMLVGSVFTSILPHGSLGESKTALVSNLIPFSVYTFRVEACTKVGCAMSSLTSERTMQALPKGLQNPRVLVTSATTVDIEWNEPSVPNGVIKDYAVLRNSIMVYRTTLRRYIDMTVLPAKIYTYQIEAYNEAGSSRSPTVTIETPESSPSGIPIPILAAMSSSAVNVTWSAPTSPNGVIIRYSVIYQEKDKELITQHTSGLFWSIISALKPYTFYYIRIQACTVVSCGVGPRGVIRTKEAKPFGQEPPRLEAKTNTMIEIKWSAPSTPNGEITEFQVERREGESESGMPVMIYIGSRNEYLDTQLKVYTVYHYRIRSRNIMGVAESEWASVRTLEGAPEGVSTPRIEVMNSTAFKFTWVAPTKPNGKITGYSIRYGLLTLSGNDINEKCCFSKDVFSVEINDFKPATRYEFQLCSSTSAGRGCSSWTIASTNEAKPGDVPILKVNRNPTNDGTTLEIYWDKPKQPNGIITKYMLHDQTSVLYEGPQRKALVRRLQPYTNYTFSLVVCTSAGCKNGPNQVLTTAEITPKGQLPPTFNLTSSSFVRIVWKPPLFPHGEIVKYQVIRELVKARRRRAENIIYTTSGTNTDLHYVDTNVKPFTTYRYKIRTINSRGSVDSDWLIVKTPEAAPQGVSNVTLTNLPDIKVLLTWLEPAIPNGKVLYYNVFRNGTRLDSTSSTTYLDISQSLRPNTPYSYVVSSCTSGGCTQSEIATIKTLEAAPENIGAPSLVAITSSSVQATWKEPLKLNGEITKYQLFLSPKKVPVFEGYAFGYTVHGLEPFTKYAFHVSACTAFGCTYSKLSIVVTLEDLPEGISKPELYVVGSKAIDVLWSPPSKPNGIITYYVIMRGSEMVYNGTDLKFTDRTVAPGKIYEYRVVAYNSVGSRSSLYAKSERTNPSAPESIDPPILTILTSSDILVTWKKPAVSNGIITGYYILYDDKTINVGKVLQYTARSLLPYTEYDFRVKACTSVDQSQCTSSLSSRGRTLEAPPEQQNPPYFNSRYITASSIKAFWNEPLKPNGVIVKYELYRRNKQRANISQLVYDGTELSFTDASGILVNTMYEYKVVAYNKLGSVESVWSAVTTSGKLPTVLPLSVDSDDVTIDSFKGRITAPKGEIKRYYITIQGGGEMRNITNIDMIGLTVTVTGLTPTTSYKVRVFACNEVGCGSSETTIVTTKNKPPTGFNIKPTILWKTSKAFGLSWPSPTITNGVIIKYEVVVFYSCPQPAKLDNCRSFSRIIPYLKDRAYNMTSLDPYSLYSVHVRAFNTESSYVESNVSIVLTIAEEPQLKKEGIKLTLVNGTEVIVDWSNAFELNSKLKKFELYENDVLGYSGGDRITKRPDRVEGTYRYKVTVTTDVNGAEKTLTTDEVSIVIRFNNTPMTSAQSGEEPWYKTIWFLALCALAFVLLVFSLIVCCCRGYRRNRSVYVRQREPLPTKHRFGTRGMDIDADTGYPRRIKRSSLKTPLENQYREMEDISTSQPFTKLQATDEFNAGEHTTKYNSVYEEDDFIWDNTPNASRDLDSGLFDDDGMSPSFADPEIEHTEDGFVSLQQERILFPDTHL